MVRRIVVYENSSGFAQYSHKICNSLARQYPDYEIHYLTDSHNKYLEYVDDRVIVKPILKVMGQVKGNKFAWLVKRLYAANANIHIRNKYVKKNKIDILNIQSTISVIERFFFKRVCRKNNVVLTVHDVIPPIKSFYWTKKSLKKLYTVCEHLIVHSLDNKNQLIEKFGISGNKIDVIHHGTDIEYKKLDKEDCFKRFGLENDGTPVLLFFGMIREQKGLDDLIKAINMMEIPCRLMIAGAMPRGESFDKYERLMGDKSRFITLVKYIDEDEVDYLYQMCEAVVFPYKYFSSQSGVFMQSIKYRKPLIATNVSSFKQYIEDYGIGWVSEPEDPKDLKENIESFLATSREDRIKINENLEKAAYDNSWEKAAILYNNTFINALQGNR